MSQENEDNEIDQYLVKKINDAIDLLSEPKNVLAKSYSFKTEVTKLLSVLREPTNPKVQDDDWLGVRRGNLYTLNNLVIEWQQTTKNQTSFPSKEVYDARENIKKSLRTIKKEINGEQESRGDPDPSRHSYHGPELPEYKTFTRHTSEIYRWSSRHEPRRVHGIDHRVLAMVRELVMRNTDAPFKVFGVVGISGIGKTTLCQRLFGNDFVKQHFSPRIWVCLSKQEKVGNEYYKEEILVRMLKCLGMKEELIDDARKADGLKKLVENEYYKEGSLVRMLKCLGIEKELIDDARKDGGLKKLVENEYYKEEILVRMLKRLGIEEELINDARKDGGLKKLVENEYYKEEILVRMLKRLGIEEELINDARKDGPKKLVESEYYKEGSLVRMLKCLGIEEELNDDARKAGGLKKRVENEYYKEESLVRMLKWLGIEEELIDDARKGGLKKLVENEYYKEESLVRMLKCLGIVKEELIDDARKGGLEKLVENEYYKEEILVRMLNCLGIEEELIDDARKGGLKKMILLLRLQLNDKRYLIVLDDAWNDDKFFYNLTQKDRLDENWGAELAYALPKGDGGTVVSSSTDKELLKKMLGEEVSLQYMEPLNREITWEIFRDAVIGYDDDERVYDKNLDEIKEELLNRCDGIPLAAKLLAKIACKNLEIKSKGPKPATAGGERSYDIGKPLAAGHEQLRGSESGAHVSEIGDDQTA